MAYIDQNEKFSVLIPDGEASYSLSVLRCLSMHKNVKVHVLSSDGWSPVRYSRYVSSFTTYQKKCSLQEKLNTICDVIKKYSIDIVLPVDCNFISFLSANRHIVSNNTTLAFAPHEGSMNIALDKWLLGKWMLQNNIPCPVTYLYTEAKTCSDYPALKYPVLIKPRKGSGGAGIKFFDNATALHIYCDNNDCNEKYIIQSFINGFDIDCSVLCKDGQILSYTIQKGCMYSKAKVSWPSGIDFFHHEETYSVVENLIKKLNWSGIVHIDLRYDEETKKINVIEMNPRFWASVSASLFAGVNFPYIACMSALKREICKSVIKPTRVVRSAAAIKLTTKKIINRNNPDLHFDHSFLEFALKDPLPNIVGEAGKLFNKFIYKKN